jgi:hypothetical protein
VCRVPSFQRLITESPEARSIPAWFTRLLIELTMLRGRLDGLASPERSVRLASTVPVFFIHSVFDRFLARLFPG